jgi:hypothetical protein
MLAVDPPVYRKVRGPQEPTAMHNTLLIGGQGQRDCRGQSYRTLEIYERHRTGEQMLETGDILFHRDAGRWAAVSGQFGQAYDSTLVSSVVRQLLYVRQGMVVVVDHLKAPAGKTMPEVTWLLQAPAEPSLNPERKSATTSSGSRTLTVVPLERKFAPAPVTASTEVNTWTVSYSYPGDGNEMLLAHIMTVGAGEGKGPEKITAERGPDYYDVRLDGRSWRFDLKPPYGVVEAEWKDWK